MTRSSDGFSFRLGSEVIVRLCGLVTLPLLTRTLGSDGYGVVIGTASLAGLGGAIGSLGLSYHVGRIVGRGESPESRRLLRQLLILAGTTGLCLAGAMAFAAPLLNGLLFGHADGRTAIMLLGGSLIAICVDGILLEWLRLRDRFRSLSLIQAVTAVLQVGMIVVLARAGWGPAAVVAGVSLLQLLRVSLMAALIHYTPRARAAGDTAFDLDLATCLRDGATLTLGTLGTWGLSQGGRLILGSATAIGGYGVAAALASAPGIAGSAGGLPLYPSLVRAVAAQRPRAAATAIRRFSTSYQLLTLPVLAIAAVLSEHAIQLLAGSGFVGLGPVCILLMLAGWIEMSALPLTYLLAARGWASRTRNAQIAAAALNLVTAVVAVPVMGAIGVAVALLAGQVAMVALLVWGLRHASFPWRALVPRKWSGILLAALIGAGIAGAIPSAHWLGLLAAGAAAVAAAASVASWSFHRPARGPRET